MSTVCYRKKQLDIFRLLLRSP
ncbi:hypothetical protein LINGRAPRIM_LOCUS935 [Linum grandiflorum]